MTREEYETSKQRLEEQLQTGIELLQAAHRRQVQALEILWSGSGEERVERVTVPPAPAVPRRKAGQLHADVVAALAKVPEVFTRNDLLAFLGYQPNRGSLYSILQDLIGEGVLATESSGEGRTPSRYRKTKTATRPSES